MKSASSSQSDVLLVSLFCIISGHVGPYKFLSLGLFFRANRSPFFLKKMTLCVDLLNPLESSEKRSHKLKRLVQSPNSYFMDVKCSGKKSNLTTGCFQITTVFSHAQTVV